MAKTQNIVESFITKGQILEQDSTAKNDAILCRAKYQICEIGKKNRNNRIYEKAVWDSVLINNDIQEKLKNKSLFFHAEHPATTQSNTEKVAGVVTDINLNESENKVYAIMEVLDTPYGKIVDTLLRAGCGIGVSTRADGELEEALDEKGEKYQRVVPESYRFVTIDFTADPSSYGSELPLTVERDVVSIVKDGIDSEKIDRDYATVLLNELKIPEAVALLESIKSDKGHNVIEERLDIDPKFLLSLAHKAEYNKGTWWYSLKTGEIKINQGKHSDKEFKDIMYKPGWLGGRVLSYQGENILLVYLRKTNLINTQLLDLIKKLERELSLTITDVRDKDGNEISNLLESLIERTSIKKIDWIVESKVIEDQNTKTITLGDVLHDIFITNNKTWLNALKDMGKEKAKEALLASSKKLEDEVIKSGKKINKVYDDADFTELVDNLFEGKLTETMKRVKCMDCGKNNFYDDMNDPLIPCEYCGSKNWGMEEPVRDFHGNPPEEDQMDKEDYEAMTSEELDEVIHHEGSKWVVRSKKGKNLGSYDTEAKAKKRLRQVEFFKHNNESTKLQKNKLNESGSSLEVTDFKPGDYGIYSNFGLRELVLIRVLPWPHDDNIVTNPATISGEEGDAVRIMAGPISHDKRRSVYCESVLTHGIDDEYYAPRTRHFINPDNLYKNLSSLLKSMSYLSPGVLRAESDKIKSEWSKYLSEFGLYESSSDELRIFCPDCGWSGSLWSLSLDQDNNSMCPVCKSMKVQWVKSPVPNEKMTSSADITGQPANAKAADQVAKKSAAHNKKQEESQVEEKLDPDDQEVANISKKYGFGSVAWQDAMIARIRRKLENKEQLTGTDTAFIQTQMMHNKSLEIEELERMWKANNGNVPNESKVNEDLKTAIEKEAGIMGLKLIYDGDKEVFKLVDKDLKPKVEGTLLDMKSYIRNYVQGKGFESITDEELIQRYKALASDPHQEINKEVDELSSEIQKRGLEGKVMEIGEKKVKEDVQLTVEIDPSVKQFLMDNWDQFISEEEPVKILNSKFNIGEADAKKYIEEISKGKGKISAVYAMSNERKFSSDTPNIEISELSKRLASITAERNRLVENYANDAIGFTIKIEEQKKLAETAVKTIAEQLDNIDKLKIQLKEINEYSRKLEETSKQVSRKIQEERNEEARRLSEEKQKEIKELNEAHSRELIKQYIGLRTKGMGLNLTESVLTLLESCKSTDEVDALIRKTQDALREGLVHSTGNLTEIVFDKPVNPVMADLSNKIGIALKHFTGL